MIHRAAGFLHQYKMRAAAEEAGCYSITLRAIRWTALAVFLPI